VRFNIVFGGGAALMDAERMAARIRRLGWHLQFLIDVSKVPDLSSPPNAHDNDRRHRRRSCCDRPSPEKS